MVNDTGESLPPQISDADLLWAGLNEWQVAYLSQASNEQREIVYREAIRVSMGNATEIPGMGI